MLLCLWRLLEGGSLEGLLMPRIFSAPQALKLICQLRQQVFDNNCNIESIVPGIGRSWDKKPYELSALQKLKNHNYLRFKFVKLKSYVIFIGYILYLLKQLCSNCKFLLFQEVMGILFLEIQRMKINKNQASIFPFQLSLKILVSLQRGSKTLDYLRFSGFSYIQILRVLLDLDI